jgi:K+-transporting ATPase ATPase C chain
MRDLVRAGIAIVIFTAVFGFLYPVVLTGFAAVAFPDQSKGSLIHENGKLVGSSLAAQAFTRPRYFHPRPSATTPPYNAGATTFANLGPTSGQMATQVRGHLAAILKLERPYNPGLTAAGVPVDAVTTSGSGIDPDISPANARLQSRRIAAVRHLPLSTVDRLISRYTDGRSLGFLGEPGVNVLELNLALDRGER